MWLHTKRGDDGDWKNDEADVCDDAGDDYEAQYGKLIASAGQCLTCVDTYPIRTLLIELIPGLRKRALERKSEKRCCRP